MCYFVVWLTAVATAEKLNYAAWKPLCALTHISVIILGRDKQEESLFCCKVKKRCVFFKKNLKNFLNLKIKIIFKIPRNNFLIVIHNTKQN